VIQAAAREVSADVIVPTGLAGIRLVAEFQNELAPVSRLPPLASLDVLDAFSDKLRFSKILNLESIPHPRILWPSGELLDEEKLFEMRFPVLVKPRNLEGGSGIRLCEYPHQVLDYLAEQGEPAEFFVQEFIKGPDLSCSVLCQEGEILAYTIQRVIVRSHKPFGPSAAVEFIHDEGVLDSIQRLVSSVRWSGVACFDLVFDEEANQAKVLEANPRYWRSLLGSLAAGVNFPHLACMASQGEKFTCPDYQHVRYAKPEIAPGLILKSWTGKRSAISKVSESGLPYLLRDPLPEVAIHLRRKGKSAYAAGRGLCLSSLYGLRSR
jgi:predicted ATP-grasp superfamily ATP-dependent carboligase